MNNHRRSKMTRQLQIYYTLTTSKIIGPEDLMNQFGVSRRMLQRDLKDLHDCGLIHVKYDRKKKQYVSAGDAVFDKTAKERRRMHLLRLYRIGTLIHELSRTGTDELHMYESALEDYEYDLRLSKENPAEYPPEEIMDKPDPFDFPNIKAEYYALFPQSNERTRQRDFAVMNRAGFRIYYSRQHRVFIFEYDEYNNFAIFEE